MLLGSIRSNATIDSPPQKRPPAVVSPSPALGGWGMGECEDANRDERLCRRSSLEDHLILIPSARDGIARSVENGFPDPHSSRSCNSNPAASSGLD